MQQLLQDILDEQLQIAIARSIERYPKIKFGFKCSEGQYILNSVGYLANLNPTEQTTLLFLCDVWERYRQRKLSTYTLLEWLLEKGVSEEAIAIKAGIPRSIIFDVQHEKDRMSLRPYHNTIFMIYSYFYEDCIKKEQKYEEEMREILRDELENVKWHDALDWVY